MSTRRRTVRCVAVAAALVGLAAAPPCFAAITNSSGTNVQDGSNAANSHQSGDAQSGDALSGAQVVAVQSAGRVSVTAQNDATDSSAASGDVGGSNLMSITVGPVRSAGASTAGSPLTTSVSTDDVAKAPRFDARPVGPPGPFGPAVTGGGPYQRELTDLLVAVLLSNDAPVGVG